MYVAAKRGQVTLFIILAIIIIALVVLGFLFFTGRLALPLVGLPSEIQTVKDYTQDCVKLTAENAIVFIGMQGGVAEPSLALETEIGNISYWVYEGRDNKPTLESIETDISSYIKYVLPLCTNDFYPFISEGYEINESEVMATTSIGENEIFIKVTYPINIKKGIASAKIQDFSTSIPIRFKKIYNEASKIADMHAVNIDVELLAESELDIAILQYSDEDYIYTITDNSSIILNAPYTFLMAAR